MHCDIKKDCQNAAPLAFFIPNGIRATRNCQNFLFLKMKATGIHNKLALGFSDDVCTFVSVQHWFHKFKIGGVLIGDESRPEKPPLDDFDVAILKRLLEAPFSSLQTLSEDLHISRIMVREHMTKLLVFNVVTPNESHTCSRRSFRGNESTV
jgi:hypothetical protein